METPEVIVPAEDASAVDAQIVEHTLDDFKDAFPSSKMPREEPAAPAAEPAAVPQPKTRHRAQSQIASPEDVKAISELTKRAKDAEATAFADIKQNPGESDRVFGLRRRAEIAERVAKGTAAVPATPVVARSAPAVEPPRVVPAAKDPQPTEELDPSTGKPYENFTKFVTDHARWSAREEMRTARSAWETEQQTATVAEREAQLARNWTANITAAKAIHADFEAVAYGPSEIPEGSLVDRWIREHPAGPLVLYSLKKNPTELHAMLAMPLFEQTEALTLLSQRVRPKTSAAAVTTGAAPVQEVKPVPRPPTPVRTGSQRTSDDAPPDLENVGLDDFAAATGANTRRRS